MHEQKAHMVDGVDIGVANKDAVFATLMDLVKQFEA